MEQDQHLYTTAWSRPSVVWRPRSSVVPDTGPCYRAFTHLGRTLHLDNALDSCLTGVLLPSPITKLSTLQHNILSDNHPCKHLRVLWFSPRAADEDDNVHSWYGNVEFVLPIQTVLDRWRNVYLVEMISFPTYTLTRIMLTNSDYSLMPKYDPRTPEGPWFLGKAGHQALQDCRRYQGGTNRHGHELEFMIEAIYEERIFVEECKIVFRNHKNAMKLQGVRVCHRRETKCIQCNSPFSRDQACFHYFKEHRRLWYTSPYKVFLPQLSTRAMEQRSRMWRTDVQLPSQCLYTPF